MATALYAAFDRFPSPKGAATHLAAWAPELARQFGSAALVVLGGADSPAWQREGDLEIVRHRAPARDPLERAIGFGRRVQLVAAANPDLRLVQARDPWGAAGLLEDERVRRGTVPLVLEVNGLPSIELPETRPGLTPVTLEKIRGLEQRCLDAATAVVVPSGVIAGHLADRGVEPERCRVVPNGADPPAHPLPRPDGAPARYLAYVGAVQPWQGIGVLLAAMTRLRDLDVDLVICAAAPPRRCRDLRRRARRLGVADRVHWYHGLPRAEVAAWLAGAAASVAPLRATPRNVTQGCCPLKVLESMAVATPVVGSDLPAVRELVTDGCHGRLVPPDRPDALARALRVLLDHPDRAAEWGAAARAHVEAGLTWDHSRRRLAELYAEVGSRHVRT